jgi:hypothetical protein
MKKSNITLRRLKKSLEHVEYYNKMAPFPVYDTEYVEDIKKRIMELENSKEDYDALPVEACRFCKDLNIIVDEVDNTICKRCGSVNEIQTFKNIYEYLDFIKDGKK